MTEIEKIRKAEKKSHEEMYTRYELFKKGSWLEKPVKAVMDLLPLIEEKESINILDLGCGVGRNTISIAQYYKDNNCKIDAVDLLELAIKKLNYYSIYYDVDSMINGIVSSIEDYNISTNRYDLVLAVSVLEHLNSIDTLLKKLYEIREGIKINGYACFICNSNVEEINLLTNKNLSPQFECLLTDNELDNMIIEVFKDFEFLKRTLKRQTYNIPREKEIIKMNTDVVTYVLKKRY